MKEHSVSVGHRKLLVFTTHVPTTQPDVSLCIHVPVFLWLNRPDFRDIKLKFCIIS